MKSIHYRAKKNRRYFRPRPIRVFKNRIQRWRLDFEVVFKENCQYVFKHNGGIDKDQDDWSKAFGITMFNWLSLGMFMPNTDALLLGWRAKLEGGFEVAPYVNINKKFETGKILDVIPNEKIIVSFEKIGPVKYKTVLSDGSTFLEDNFVLRTKGMARIVNPVFGGANNSPGPFGGKTPHKMNINVSYKLLVNKL